MSDKSSRSRSDRATTLSSAAAARTDAAHVSEHLEAIRRALRKSVWAQTRELPVPLTAPQVHALELLVDEVRASGRGLSLSELSQRMGLAHSTVSGIVDRLATRGLVQRIPGAEDRRFVSVELTQPVKGWLERDLPASRLSPIAAALAKANARERRTILEGVAILRELLE